MTRKHVQFMAWCIEGAQLFSTCSRRQYMAILTDDHHRVTGIGYNGAAPGQTHCVDGGCPRAQADVAHGSNYDNCVAIHAEQNALIHSVGTPTTLYVNGPPCFTCAKLIAARGTIREVVYLVDEAYGQFLSVAKYLFDNGIVTLKYTRVDIERNVR